MVITARKCLFVAIVATDSAVFVVTLPVESKKIVKRVAMNTAKICSYTSC